MMHHLLLNFYLSREFDFFKLLNLTYNMVLLKIKSILRNSGNNKKCNSKGETMIITSKEQRKIMSANNIMHEESDLF